MRQGNDVGTQYRSAILWTSDAQRDAALRSRERFQAELTGAKYGPITTEIAEAGPFYYAEPYHQQYLAANPNGYCGLGGTGVSCPIGVGATAALNARLGLNRRRALSLRGPGLAAPASGRAAERSRPE